MMSLRPRESDLGEKILLKWLQSDFDWAEDESRANAGSLLAFAELLSVVGQECAAIPVAVKNSRNFVDNVRVTSPRHAHVPLESRHLRRVREIRRPDVSRREAGSPMKKPAFRVQSSGSGVIGHPNLCPSPLEGIERASFC